jgi:hypothetical protein
MDIVFHLNDVSSAWFHSNGHVLVEIDESNEEQPSPFYKVNYNKKQPSSSPWIRCPNTAAIIRLWAKAANFVLRNLLNSAPVLH